MNTYICFYNGKRHEVKADTTLQAQELGAAHFKVKKSWKVSVALAELNGTPYVHTAVN